MASSPIYLKSHCHDRSNSLPSKPHPVILQCQEHLDRLRASNATFLSTSLLSQKLCGLQDLHDCVEKLVQLPVTHEVLLQENQENNIDELLDGSLRVLDVCTAAKDSLLHTLECARELQSIMRRRKGGEMEITTEARRYLNSRKVVRKAIIKAMRTLKGVGKKCNYSPANTDQQTLELMTLLKDVEGVTLSVIETILYFISGPTQSKSSSWLLVSRLMHTKRLTCAQVVDESEFAQVDATLQSFVYHKTSESGNISTLQSQLEKLESRIEDIEEGLDFLFRRLIKTRVALLNILNH